MKRVKRDLKAFDGVTKSATEHNSVSISQAIGQSIACSAGFRCGSYGVDGECGPACNQERGRLKRHKFGSCDPV